MKLSIFTATIYLILYILAIQFTGISDFTFLLFTFSPVPVFYMAYKILKDDYRETSDFEDHFYADKKNYKRLNTTHKQHV